MLPFRASAPSTHYSAAKRPGEGHASSPAWQSLPPGPASMPACARAHCTRGRPSVPSQRLRRTAATAKRIPPEWPSCPVSFLFLRRRDAAGQALEFSPAHDFRIDHAHQQVFDRSRAEPVHDALHGAASHLLWRLRRAVHECPVVQSVRKVTLFLQPPQHGPNRRILQRPAQSFTDLIGGCLAETPDDTENFAFEFAKLSRIMCGWSATRHSVTHCNT